MMTPEKLRLEAAKLDAYMEAFERTYLHFLEIGSEEPEQRERGTFAFYEIRDKVDWLIEQMDVLAGHMEVCNAIAAVHKYRD